MSNEKPNFIIVLLDDLGYGDLGCFGSETIRSPRIDSLAAEGAKLTAMYTPVAVCSPSRAALLTGRQPQRTGVTYALQDHDTIGLPASELTLAQLLKDQGYRTALAGKWHLGSLPQFNPTHYGFDYFFGVLYSNDLQPFDLYKNEAILEKETNQAALSRRFTNQIIQFIRKAPDQPFFAYLSHIMPHEPLSVEAPFQGKSRAGLYGDTIESVDFHLGRLLDRLEGEFGIRDNTFIVVLSDNGPWHEGSAGGLSGRKRSVYEGGVRVPCVIRYPRGIPPGLVIDQPTSMMDFVPTMVRMAGGALPPDREYDGLDIGPALAGGPMPARPPLFFTGPTPPNVTQSPATALRAGRWKLVVAPGTPDRVRLYDLEADSAESMNLAADHPDVVAQMLGEINTLSTAGRYRGPRKTRNA
ncbi:MAG: sulfatase [Caldilineales bacterium]|nr:sulfatase [Caldilineales bacterium]MCW5860905.1 sulfatase [Caldilineales bacterium]